MVAYDIIMPVLGRWRPVGQWAYFPSLISLLDEFQANGKVNSNTREAVQVILELETRQGYIARACLKYTRNKNTMKEKLKLKKLTKTSRWLPKSNAHHTRTQT